MRYLWLCVTYFLSVEDDKWLDKSHRASFSFKTFISSYVLQVFVVPFERLICFDIPFVTFLDVESYAFENWNDLCRRIDKFGQSAKTDR